MRSPAGRSYLLPFPVAVAALLAWLCVAPLAYAPTSAHAALTVETHDVLDFEYQQTGASEEEAVRLACIRAVQATVGRVLFSDYSLQARDLLDPYIQKNWQKFVASYYVLERRFDRDAFGCRIRVQTYPEVLSRDLRDKKFLFLPRPNPYHAVFFAETVDGQYGETEAGRTALINALKDAGMKVSDGPVNFPPQNTYVMSSPEAFTAARQAAARLGAEVIVTGAADTTAVERREIYYDPIVTYETHLRIDFVKVDDGSVIASADVTMRASDRDPAGARDASITEAVRAAAAQVAQQTAGLWPRTVTDRTKFSLMFSDVTPEETEAVIRHLESNLGYGTRARLKAWYGRVAVLNLDTERDYSALERVVQDFRAFKLRITDRRGHRVTVTVQH